MTWSRAKQAAGKFWMCYLTGFLVLFTIKYLYSRAGSNELGWILAPTAWWVRILGGIPFENVAGVGYVNHSLRFIIAPSCSGVQFLVTAAATLMCSYMHRMGTAKQGFFWIGMSVGISWLFTIFVNGFRILLAIRLPQYLGGPGGLLGWLKPEQLHTVIGITVYFTALWALYHVTGRVLRKMPARRLSGSPVEGVRSFIPPLFWYFAIVLGIPFLNRAYKNEKFWEYGLLMIAVCLAIVSLSCLTAAVRRFVNKVRR